MATPKVRVGDDIGLSCTILRGLSAVPIDPSAVIRAAIVNTRGTKSYTGSITLDMADVNHDLEDGVVWVVIPAANTGTMIPGKAILEIEIVDATQKVGNQTATWTTPVVVVQTTIN